LLSEDCDDTNTSAFDDNGVSEDCSATSCKDILDRGYSSGDGNYWVDPDGSSAFEAYCDMTTDGGGWTLIAQGGNKCQSTGMAQSTQMTKTDSCLYLPVAVVSQLATSATTVMLQVGNNTSSFGDWSKCSESTNTASTNCTSTSQGSLVITALTTATGDWHNGAVFDYWDWSGAVGSHVSGWPNMYQASTNGDGVHWLVISNYSYVNHDTNSGGAINEISATWIR
jgi:hypothetical protein